MSGAQLFAYGRPGFGIAAALIKILAFVVLFAMGLGQPAHMVGAASVGHDAGPAGPQPRQHRALACLGDPALRRRRAEDDVQGGLHPAQGTPVPVHAGAHPGSRASADRAGHHSLRGAAVLGAHADAVPLGTCARPVDLQIARLDVGVLFYFAFASLSIYGVTLAGWASYNKWALMGGMRAASQMISYEVTMGMAVLAMFVCYGTLEPGAMVLQQGPWPWQWGIVRGVPHFIAFFLFLTAALAETKRTPFDLPEGESEIVGYFVEYSGLRFGMFYLGSFSK